MSRSSDPAVAADQDAEHERQKTRIANEGIARMEQLQRDEQAALDAINAANSTARETQGYKNDKAIRDRMKALEAAKAELATLRQKAAVERQDKELGKAPGFAPAAMPLAADDLKQKVFGTFSAAAFAAGGGGESPTVKELREQRKIHHDALKEAMRIRTAVEKAGVLRS